GPAVAGVKPDCGTVPADDQSIAVMLDFMDPIGGRMAVLKPRPAGRGWQTLPANPSTTEITREIRMTVRSFVSDLSINCLLSNDTKVAAARRAWAWSNASGAISSDHRFSILGGSATGNAQVAACLALSIECR